MATKTQTPAAENPAAPKSLIIHGIDVSTWEDDRAVGFLPYLKVLPGTQVVAQINMKDMRNPSFQRYVFTASHDTDCQRGPAEDAEPTQVKAGETFSLNVFETLEAAFDDYLESGIMCRVMIHAVKKVKTSTEGRSAWTWVIKVHPDDMKQLRVFRGKKAAELKAAGPGRSLESAAS